MRHNDAVGMRVGIRVHALGEGGGGNTSYLRNLIQALPTVHPTGDYTLFLNEPVSPDVLPGVNHMHQVAAPARFLKVPVPLWHNGLRMTQVMVPDGSASLSLIRERIDVVHVQLAAPMLFGAPLVLTLHDISYERYPQFFTPDIVTKLRVRVPLTIRRAFAVLTDSEFSKQDIVGRYGVPPEKVVVAYLAASPLYRPLDDVGRLAAVRERYGTGNDFILCVGDLQPRKNLKTLIASYVRLRRADATRHRLVLVGRRAWLYDEIFALARDSGYADDLVFTGFVSDDDLVALYNAAALFVYPSLFEGFGLPPLEAMACGTPVVTSNTSSLPEIVGGAALTVNPLDSEALAHAIISVLTNPDLQRRLSAEGQQRAVRFSWEETARTTLGVYNRVARRRGHGNRDGSWL